MQTRLDRYPEQDTAPGGGGFHDPLVSGRIVIWQLSCFLPLVGDRLRSLGKYAGKTPILLFYSMGKIGVLLIHVMNIHLID